MSDPTAASYLAIVKDEVGSRLQPVLEQSSHQQIAMCSQRILARLVVNVRSLPALRKQAMDGYQALVGPLKEVLHDEKDARLVTELEALLQGDGDYRQVEALLQQISTALAAKAGHGRAHDLLKQIVAIENRLQSGFLAAYKEEMSKSSVDASTGEVFSPQQLLRLRDWLKTRFPGNDALEISGTKVIPGGFSKQTIFVSFNNANTLPATVVIRLDWSASAVGTTVVDEFHIIQTLFDAGVAVPQPFAMEDSGAVLGGPFLVVSKIEGSNIGDALDVQNGSKSFAEDMARTLAKLHSVPPESFGDAVAGAKETTRERMLREITGFESSWRALNEPSVALEIAFAWLQQNIELADGQRALIHKDVGCHNMLAKDDKLTALLDWETAAIGNPAQDLGYAYPSVIQMCDWNDFMATYAATGVPVPSQAQIDYYTLWGFTWLNVMLMQARAAFTSGAAPDIRLGYAGAYLLAKLQARLSEQLHKLI